MKWITKAVKEIKWGFSLIKNDVAVTQKQTSWAIVAENDRVAASEHGKKPQMDWLKNVLNKKKKE